MLNLQNNNKAWAKGARFRSRKSCLRRRNQRLPARSPRAIQPPQPLQPLQLWAGRKTAGNTKGEDWTRFHGCQLQPARETYGTRLKPGGRGRTAPIKNDQTCKIWVWMNQFQRGHKGCYSDYSVWIVLQTNRQADKQASKQTNKQTWDFFQQMIGSFHHLQILDDLGLPSQDLGWNILFAARRYLCNYFQLIKHVKPAGNIIYIYAYNYKDDHERIWVYTWSVVIGLVMGCAWIATCSRQRSFQVRVGEQLMGKVTNIYRDRVWVDVGLVKDGSCSDSQNVFWEIGAGLTCSMVKIWGGYQISRKCRVIPWCKKTCSWCSCRFCCVEDGLPNRHVSLRAHSKNISMFVSGVYWVARPTWINVVHQTHPHPFGFKQGRHTLMQATVLTSEKRKTWWGRLFVC